MRIFIITGTMPDIIKLASVVWEAENRKHKVTIVHTNQHFDNALFTDMYKSVNLRQPDIILTKNLTLGGMLEELMTLFTDKKPAIVLTHGDTKTAMIASVAAHYLGIPVGHVEAGLRTGSREPWPEQTDTRIADACSNLFFAPTKRNANDLINEGFDYKNIITCGNTIVDIVKKISKAYKRNNSSNKVYFSAHREENLRSEKRFKNIVKFADFLVKQGLEVNWVMRPKTKIKLKEYNLELNKDIKVIDNLTYPESINLIMDSKFVCTDSGGLQEESSALHVPCLTMRYVTDRPETVSDGCNILTTLLFSKMKEAYEELIENYDEMTKIECPYGKGNSAEKIIKFIESRKYSLINWEDDFKEE